MEDEPQTAARVSRAIKLRGTAREEAWRDGEARGKERRKEKREFHGGGASGCNEWNFESELYNKMLQKEGDSGADRSDRKSDAGSGLQTTKPSTTSHETTMRNDGRKGGRRMQQEVESTMLGA